jgi:hypothetical protein
VNDILNDAGLSRWFTAEEDYRRACVAMDGSAKPGAFA